MKKNIGKTDKMLRIVAGVVILLIGLLAGSWWGLIGVIPIVTASLGWCPAYVPFGITTCKTTNAANQQ